MLGAVAAGAMVSNGCGGRVGVACCNCFVCETNALITWASSSCDVLASVMLSGVVNVIVHVREVPGIRPKNACASSEVWIKT